MKIFRPGYANLYRKMGKLLHGKFLTIEKKDLQNINFYLNFQVLIGQFQVKIILL